MIRMQREHTRLVQTIEKHLPEFKKMCESDSDIVLLHQDAFAADYQSVEYSLLGKAIKYAGLFGKEVRIIGKNKETI